MLIKYEYCLKNGIIVKAHKSDFICVGSNCEFIAAPARWKFAIIIKNTVYMAQNTEITDKYM